MIRTDYPLEDQSEEYNEGVFMVNGDDDSAFFNLDLGGTSTFGKKKQTTGTMGGFVRNEWKTRDTTIAAGAKSTIDPSASCSKNCDSCVLSFLCKSSFKGLSSLGGGNFIPKLG